MAKMDLVSSPVLALKISKEDFDPDQCKFCGIRNKCLYKISVVKIGYIHSNILFKYIVIYYS
jgi:hypothetical protein